MSALGHRQHFLERANTTAQLHVPKIVIKETHPAGSQEHQPKITGLTWSQGVLIKHENQLISAQGRKLKIDLTKLTTSAALRVGQPGWKPPSSQGSGCVGAQFLQIYLSHRPRIPKTSKKSCL